MQVRYILLSIPLVSGKSKIFVLKTTFVCLLEAKVGRTPVIDISIIYIINHFVYQKEKLRQFSFSIAIALPARAE